jgi:hypothetical protein
LRRVEFRENLHIFRRPNVRQLTDAKGFLKGRSEKAKEMAMSDETQFCEARNMAKTELLCGISLDCCGAAALRSYR